MKCGCDTVYLESECPNGICGTRSNCKDFTRSKVAQLECPDECEVEALAECAVNDILLSQYFECVDPKMAIRNAVHLVKCLPWCNQCQDPGRLLILVAAHLSALSQLQRASATAQVNAAVKGTINPAVISNPNHWDLTIPGKMFVQLRPRSIGIAGAAIF